MGGKGGGGSEGTHEYGVFVSSSFSSATFQLPIDLLSESYFRRGHEAGGERGFCCSSLS